MIKLERPDLKRLVNILSTRVSSWQLSSNRVRFVRLVLGNDDEANNIMNRINFDGAAIDVATGVINFLANYGQLTTGEEVLGIFLKDVQGEIGQFEEDNEYIRSLFAKYGMQDSLPKVRPIRDTSWLGYQTNAQVKEKIIGENVMRPIYYLDIARNAARAVVKVRMTDDGSSGTGFVLAERLIMTNHHVCDSRDRVADVNLVFNYERDQYGEQTVAKYADGKPNGLFYSNAELDYTIFEVETMPEGIDVSSVTLSNSTQDKDKRIAIIHHPVGLYKMISLQNNLLVYADDKILQYVTSTRKGSSGAPIFNDAFLVVGIHHSGGEFLEPMSGIATLRNAGTPMVAVIADLREKASHKKREDVQQILSLLKIK